MLTSLISKKEKGSEKKCMRGVHKREDNCEVGGVIGCTLLYGLSQQKPPDTYHFGTTSVTSKTARKPYAMSDYSKIL